MTIDFSSSFYFFFANFLFIDTYFFSLSFSSLNTLLNIFFYYHYTYVSSFHFFSSFFISLTLFFSLSSSYLSFLSFYVLLLIFTSFFFSCLSLLLFYFTFFRHLSCVLLMMFILSSLPCFDVLLLLLFPFLHMVSFPLTDFFFLLSFHFSSSSFSHLTSLSSFYHLCMFIRFWCSLLVLFHVLHAFFLSLTFPSLTFPNLFISTSFLSLFPSWLLFQICHHFHSSVHSCAHCFFSFMFSCFRLLLFISFFFAFLFVIYVFHYFIASFFSQTCLLQLVHLTVLCRLLYSVPFLITM